MNSDVTLPANAYMHFNHSFGFESTTPSATTRYDGGVLEYSTNSGTSWTDAGSLITHNGYNGTLGPVIPWVLYRPFRLTAAAISPAGWI